MRTNGNGEFILSARTFKTMITIFTILISLLGMSFGWGIKVSKMNLAIEHLQRQNEEKTYLIKVNTDNINEINQRLARIEQKLDDAIHLLRK